MEGTFSLRLLEEEVGREKLKSPTELKSSKQMLTMSSAAVEAYFCGEDGAGRAGLRNGDEEQRSITSAIWKTLRQILSMVKGRMLKLPQSGRVQAKGRRAWCVAEERTSPPATMISYLISGETRHGLDACESVPPRPEISRMPPRPPRRARPPTLIFTSPSPHLHITLTLLSLATSTRHNNSVLLCRASR